MGGGGGGGIKSDERSGFRNWNGVLIGGVDWLLVWCFKKK